MKKLKNNIFDKIERFLIFSLPVVVFFSYFPVISFGSTESMNLELSLPLIWLFLLGIFSIFRLPSVYKKLGFWRILAIFAVPLYISLSIFWSKNILRGVLTSGILWLIFLLGVNIWCYQKFSKSDKQKLLKTYLISSAVVAIFCILQCILDVFGVGRDFSLLCTGCGYQTFGFPHANGFAIEPQFMGNLLILPCIITNFILFYAIFFKKGKTLIIKRLLLCFLLNMVLYVVFSRGAIFSFVIASVLLTIHLFVKNRNFLSFLPLAVIAISFTGGLIFQGILAEISPTNEGFFEGVARSINQISLGKINLEAKKEVIPSENEAIFDGYIKESTDIRLNLNEIAIEAWQSSPVFGVGIGGGGIAISENSPLSSKEIIQNEPLNILLELGIVGLALIIAELIYTLYYLWKKQKIISFYSSIAYIISMFFFAGLPNVLHIYMISPMLAKAEKKQSMIKYKNE